MYFVKIVFSIIILLT